MIGTKNCIYETPCGWCSKWDKECDKKMHKLVESVDDFTVVVKKCTSESDHEWECIALSTDEMTYWCKKCGASKKISYEDIPLDSLTFKNINNIPNNNIPNSCKACPNHPSNGGSGICNCTAPYFEQVTCTPTADTTRLYS